MKTPIKAAVFDIDGTLTARGQSGLSPAVRRALDALRAAGVTLIVATGARRSPRATRWAASGRTISCAPRAPSSRTARGAPCARPA